MYNLLFNCREKDIHDQHWMNLQSLYIIGILRTITHYPTCSQVSVKVAFLFVVLYYRPANLFLPRQGSVDYCRFEQMVVVNLKPEIIFLKIFKPISCSTFSLKNYLTWDRFILEILL